MLTLLIALIASLLVGAASYRGLPTSAVVVMMTVVFILVHLVISLLLRMQSKSHGCESGFHPTAH